MNSVALTKDFYRIWIAGGIFRLCHIFQLAHIVKFKLASMDVAIFNWNRYKVFLEFHANGA